MPPLAEKAAAADRGGGGEAEAEEEDPLETLKKTPSASEEIFERKGWNTMDGSWRNPFDFD